MQLIDANSINLPEGDYLDMCNTIKEVHEVLKVEDQTDEEYEHQTDEERLNELEKDLHHYVMHIEKMKKQLDSIKIRKQNDGGNCSRFWDPRLKIRNKS